ncbi:MAG: HRDC domain-containing protein [bacterium]|nr:HRDC domain-containing protein [bacterium]MDE0437343.1 HRDC domain-containing protein [bacterium]
MRDQYLETHPHGRLRRAQRWLVKNRRPDGSTGRWDPDDREKVVRYLLWRDGGRCGLCALRIAAADAQIEHVVPKKFGLFSVQRSGRGGGRAVGGREWESRLHHPDNLQVAHAYCNRAKGNTGDCSKWRHPELRPLPVAKTMFGAGYLWLPERAGRDDVPVGGLAGYRETSPKRSLARTGHPSETTSRRAPCTPRSDEELLQMLKAWRTATARAHSKPAYTVLADRTLQELVSSRPSAVEDLAKVYGIGPAKLDAYGQELLDLITPKRQ